jgi:4-hydroxybenzoate polyprenyltransferase
MATEADGRTAPASRPITGSDPLTDGPAAVGLAQNLGETAEMIAFKHTVFALPFALMSLVTASGGEWPTAPVWVWVIVAMVAARTAAMSFNRLADHRIDADNPRTADRSLPAGRLSRRFAWIVTIVSALVFVLAASRLNPLCLWLALPTLAILLGYSFAKRFTSASHLWLGCALGIAPVGAWIAVTGSVAPPPLVLGAAVACWVAGFDTIYSLQDEAFDRARGLRSLPSVVGAHRALWAARGFHLLALVGFAVFAVFAGGGWIRFSAVAAAAALMLWQHRLVRVDDLSRVDAAFFSANGLLAIVMFVCFLAAKIVG